MYFNLMHLGLKQHLPCQCIQTSFLGQIMGNVQKLFILKLEPDLDPGPEKFSEQSGQNSSLVFKMLHCKNLYILKFTYIYNTQGHVWQPSDVYVLDRSCSKDFACCVLL